MDVIEQIKRHEGLELKIYQCTVGKLTIGYGRNLEDKGISKHEAELLLINDIEDVKAALKHRLPVYSKLSETRQAVLINMAFNLGINGLLGFKKMILALEYGDFFQASCEMLSSKWSSQVHGRATELAKQMSSNEWQ